MVIALVFAALLTFASAWLQYQAVDDAEAAAWDFTAQAVQIGGLGERNPEQALSLSPELLSAVTQVETTDGVPLGKPAELHLFGPSALACRALSLSLERPTHQKADLRAVLTLLPVPATDCSGQKQNWRLFTGSSSDPFELTPGRGIRIELTLPDESVHVLRNVRARTLLTDRLLGTVNPGQAFQRPQVLRELDVAGTTLEIAAITLEPSRSDTREPGLGVVISCERYTRMLLNKRARTWWWQTGLPSSGVLAFCLALVTGFIMLLTAVLAVRKHFVEAREPAKHVPAPPRRPWWVARRRGSCPRSSKKGLGT